ncbi:MAG: Hpt domain-containing protein [Acidobacteria bacterium]|nr:Hpt domain-containing protein [Acidobacteriota bacterium]MBI3423141.1 Hpt domain-containing protein [Acidobacteriota bacterium]
MNESSEDLSVNDLNETAGAMSWASGGPGDQLLPELLNGFIAEVKSYLPKLQTALDEYQRRPQQTALLAEAQRHVRTIKGAAAVVGLMPLGDLASSFEEVLEKLIASQLPVSVAALTAFTRLLLQLDHYLDAVVTGARDFPAELTQTLRELRDLTSPPALNSFDAVLNTPLRNTGPLRPILSFIPPAPAMPPPAAQSAGAPPAAAEAEISGLPDLSAWLDLNDEEGLLPLVAENPAPVVMSPPPLPVRQPSLAEWEEERRAEDAAVFAEVAFTAAPATTEAPAFAVAAPPAETLAGAEITASDAPLAAEPFEELLAPFPPADTSASAIETPVPETELDMPDIPAELLEVFLPEAEEHLRVMTLSLPALAAQPGNKALLQEIRRSAHSLKGSAAVVGFQELANLAHRAEDLLDLLYDDELKLTSELLQLLFASTEILENLLNQRADQDVLAGLYAAYAEVLAAPHPAPGAEYTFEALEALADPLPLKRTTKPLPNETAEPESDSTAEKDAPAVAVVNRGKYVRVPIDQLDTVVKLVTELLVNHAAFEQNMTTLNRQLEEVHTNSTRLNRVATKMEVQFEASTLGGGHPAPARPFSANALLNSLTQPHGLAAPLLNQNTYGFDALEFDRYTEFHLLLRELTEAASDVHALESELVEIKDDFQNCLQREARLCSDIQEKLMRLRMVPLSTLSSRLHRTVHTVAARRDKQVNLVIEGDETRLDKTVIEEIADPLLHILRNAIDHGIETPSARAANGKPTSGTIRLRAFHDNTQTVLQIGDDGSGLNPERIRQTALKNGLLSAAEAAHLSNEELYSLIFLPGFSTAEAVSEISGRGVGMDVVKSTIHRLKGSISMDSQPGQGTLFTLRLPLTLAVMRSLLVKTQQQIFAVPLAGLSQVVKLTPNLLDRIGHDTVVRTGGKVYPLLQLSKLLNLKRHEINHATQMALIMNIEGHQVAIAVDETLEGREVVVKNLGNHLRRVHGLTGATLLGDGSAVLILNLPELLREVFRPRAAFELRAEPRLPVAAQSAAPRAIASPVITTSAPKAVAAPVSVPVSASLTVPLTVMVVDDSLSVRRVLTNRLTSAGWNALQAKDGLDALEQLQQMTIPPDLLLVDIEMPRMDGYEFINTLRKQLEYADLPVIVLTSRAGQKHRDRAFEVGATEYLVKPYQDDVLLSLIRRLANRRSRES